MADDFVLEMDELRAVAAYAAACASEVLSIFENKYPEDPRPRNAVDAAQEFAAGGPRTKAIRDAAWDAMRAAKGAEDSAAAEAARSAMSAASAAYLHPIAKATQVKHILGAAAYAARTIELDSDGAAGTADRYIELACRRADLIVIDVLRRYPRAPAGGGRIGELLRILDLSLRGA